MDKYHTIGQGKRGSWPFDIAIHWPGRDRSGPIMLAEGSGHCAASGNFALADLLDAKWNENLEICDCLWLRDLAREEAKREILFTPDEILERAQEHNKL